jgi:hypothetical protein
VGLRPLAGWDCGFESTCGHGCLSLLTVVYFQVEAPVKGRSLVQRSPAVGGVSECDLETSTLKRPRCNGAVVPYKIIKNTDVGISAFA